MKPEWKDAPSWARYLAQDASGDWFWFSSQPIPVGLMWKLGPNSMGRYKPAGYTCNADGWSNSLEVAPRRVYFDGETEDSSVTNEIVVCQFIADGSREFFVLSPVGLLHFRPGEKVTVTVRDDSRPEKRTGAREAVKEVVNWANINQHYKFACADAVGVVKVFQQKPFPVWLSWGLHIDGPDWPGQFMVYQKSVKHFDDWQDSLIERDDIPVTEEEEEEFKRLERSQKSPNPDDLREDFYILEGSLAAMQKDMDRMRQTLERMRKDAGVV